MSTTQVRTTAPTHECADAGLAAAASAVVAVPQAIQVTIQGQQFVVDGPVAAAVSDVLARLASGHGVYVASLDSLLTTTQAAEVLGISRAYLYQLLDRDLIPHTMRGTHRRVPLEAVERYRDVMRTQTKESLDRVAQISRDAGEYNDDF